MLRELSFSRLFGKEVPVRGRIDNDRLKFSPKQAAFPILIRDQHKDRVLQHQFADCHGAGQGMENANLDNVLVRFGGRNRKQQRQ